MSKLKIEYIDIDKLIPYVNNPRVNDEAVDKVAGSIAEFGFKNPIIIDSENVIVAGHTRMKAARKLGLEEVPTIKVDDLTDAQIKAFRIADNKTAEFAEWDMELLEIELEDLGDMFTGFSDDELDDIMGTYDGVQEDDYEIEVPDNPKSKLGDIYQLGRHRLMCGDSTSSEDMKQLMNGKLADLTVTDPPYNINVQGQDGMTIMNDNMANDDFQIFLNDTFRVMKEALRAGGAFYIFHSDTQRYRFSHALLVNELQERQNLIWIKSSFTLGRQDYQWKHEPCLYGWKEGAAHYFINDYSQSTVIEDMPNVNQMTKGELKDHVKELRKFIDAGSTLLREDKPSSNDLHPTMKPLTLLQTPIKNNSKKGEIVLDQFGGSGSTLITCEQLERICYMMEYDPKYVDVIINRWETFTGEKAVKVNE